MEKITSLRNNLHRIQIDLPGSPLGSVNCYVVDGPDRSLLVDTGFNMDKCLDLMTESLEELGINRDTMDIFVTHLHADHSGLADRLAGEESRVYLNEYGVDVLTSDEWDVAKRFANRNGYPSDQLDDLFSDHPGKQFSSDSTPNFVSLQENDEISVGSRTFTVLDTPGHTLGHQCLYEESEKIMFAGDHIIDDITPNISVYGEHNRYLLLKYLDSLDRTLPLEIDVLYPGHRNPVTDVEKRIRELKQHHAIRTAELLELLESGPQNAYDLASRMQWEIPLDSWDEFPLIQRWFATGETLAHLWALEKEGKTTVVKDEKQTQFVKR